MASLKPWLSLMLVTRPELMLRLLLALLWVEACFLMLCIFELCFWPEPMVCGREMPAMRFLPPEALLYWVMLSLSLSVKMLILEPRRLLRGGLDLSVGL